MQSKLGLELCRHMLFLRPFTGLDTTSRIFHIGVSKIQKADTMKTVAGNSTTRNMTPSDIVDSGTQLMQNKPTLSFLRYSILA